MLNVPVRKVCFQSKHLGYDTDDLLVIADRNGTEVKLLCQIKHKLRITEKDPIFQDVIRAAWSDYQKPSFHKDTDRIALVTGFLARDSIDSLRQLHDRALHSPDEQYFFTAIEQVNFSSQAVSNKLNTLKVCLQKSNGGMMPSEREIWLFLRVFVLLIFDLDYEASINKTLASSLIRCRASQDARLVWSRLSEYAGKCNQAADCVTLKNISPDILELFNISNNGISVPSGPVTDFIPSELWALLTLIGSWDENNEKDRQVLEHIIGIPYPALEQQIRGLLTQSHSYLTLSNGIWKVRNRRQLYELCSTCYFDSTLNKAFESASLILQQKNKRFSDNGDFSLLIPQGGSFDNSDVLRKGLITGLCMVMNSTPLPLHCTEQKLKIAAHDLIRSIFNHCTWVRLASLSELLQTVAELRPACYLQELERLILQNPREIEALFPRKGNDILFSQNFISYILWSLEMLAWDERYCIPCIRCLGELALLDFEETNYANTPIRSIVSILLPWHPQTQASEQKQKNAVQLLQTEMPEIGWKVLKKLMPHETSASMDNPRPVYLLLEEPPKASPSKTQIHKMYQYYLSLAIQLAGDDNHRLSDLVRYMDYMDSQTLSAALSFIHNLGTSWDDSAKFSVWLRLCDYRYRLHANYKGRDITAFPVYKQLIQTIQKLEPTDIRIRYKRLYLSSFDEYMGVDSGIDRWKEKENDKFNAISDIYKKYGIQAVIQFGSDVNNICNVAYKFGLRATRDDISELLAAYYDSSSNGDFVFQAICGFASANGERSLLSTALDKYPPKFIGHILSKITLSSDLLEVVSQLLPQNEVYYWNDAVLSWAYYTDSNFDLAAVTEKLIAYRRYAAAVNLLGNSANITPVKDETLYQVLQLAATTTGNDKLESHAACQLIHKLQKASSPDMERLSEIEFLYLPWLDEYSSVQPKALYFRIANEPACFCELLKLYYKERHAETSNRKLSRPLSERLFQPLFRFQVIPGIDWDGTFHPDRFLSWIHEVMQWSLENDRLEVTLQTLGNGLSYAAIDGNGLIDDTIMKTLDTFEHEEMRRGYYMGVMNQRGPHFVAPEGKQEKELAAHYQQMADKTEALGYSQFSELLRGISSAYQAEAAYNIAEEAMEEEDKTDEN